MRRIVMGLESSCDETAVGIVDEDGAILANQVATQLLEHQPYGGVVPEIAARAHLFHMDALIRAALDEAKLSLGDLSGIASTVGPGLIGGVMVASMAGKALAAVRGLPFCGVNHLEAHALMARLSNNVPFPFLLLLVSGGHTQLLWVEGVGHYRCLGSTIDDAVGECFDKSAKLLGLGYPGGPALEAKAREGNPRQYELPRPMKGRKGCDFSFSGLKTAVRLALEAHQKDASVVADLSASLQEAIADVMSDRVKHAFQILADEGKKPQALVIAGGVAANQALRTRLTEVARGYDVACVAPPVKLCTDNGVMVAWAGMERLRLGLVDDLSIGARPRWPLDELKGVS